MVTIAAFIKLVSPVQTVRYTFILYHIGRVIFTSSVVMPTVPLLVMLVPVVTPVPVMRGVVTYRAGYVVWHGYVMNRRSRDIPGVEHISDRTAHVNLPVRIQYDGCAAAPTAVAVSRVVSQCRP